MSPYSICDNVVIGGLTPHNHKVYIVRHCGHCLYDGFLVLTLFDGTNTYQVPLRQRVTLPDSNALFRRDGNSENRVARLVDNVYLFPVNAHQLNKVAFGLFAYGNDNISSTTRITLFHFVNHPVNKREKFRKTPHYEVVHRHNEPSLPHPSKRQLMAQAMIDVKPAAAYLGGNTESAPHIGEQPPQASGSYHLNIPQPVEKRGVAAFGARRKKKQLIINTAIRQSTDYHTAIVAETRVVFKCPLGVETYFHKQ